MIAFFACAALVAVADWVAVGRGWRTAEYACKPGVMVLLIAAAATLTPDDPTRRAWFLGALVFSLIGDVLLMLPQDLFVPGLASFLVGHVAYVVGLVTGRESGAWAAAAAVLVIVVGVVVGTRVLRAVRRVDAAMVVPVSAYMVVISAMVVAAVGSAKPLAGVGAVLFYASDASIAWDRFVRSWSWARPWIMVTYHVGQAGLVLSLAR